jgi:hypothetical protein
MTGMRGEASREESKYGMPPPAADNKRRSSVQTTGKDHWVPPEVLVVEHA